VGLPIQGQQSTYPTLHFRLVAEPAENDAEMRFRYVLRLKGPNPSSSDANAAVANAIRALNERVPDHREYTIVLRSTATLPAIREDGEVPDDVMAWYLRRMATYVHAIDEVIKPKMGE